MRQLWAPWRLEFVTVPRKDEDCFLCRAARGGAPRRERGNAAHEQADRENLVVHRGRKCFCVMNRYPYSNGHVLVAPYAHAGDLEALGEEELLELMTMTRDSKCVLERTVHPDGFNAGLNLGADAGAGLTEHLHLHVVPRWRGDTNFMPVLADTKVIPQALMELYDRLRAGWQAWISEEPGEGHARP